MNDYDQLFQYCYACFHGEAPPRIADSTQTAWRTIVPTETQFEEFCEAIDRERYPELFFEIKSLEDLDVFIADRSSQKNLASFRFGLFEDDAGTIRLSVKDGDEKQTRRVVEEIRKLNRAQGIEPKILGDLELLNYSRCPSCGKIFSQRDLIAYYNRPFVPEGYVLLDIKRQDNRVRCDCGTFFVPALVIVENDRMTDTAYLCRLQTAQAIEDLYERETKRPVLSRRNENFVLVPGAPGTVHRRGGREYNRLVLDVEPEMLSRAPAILMNFLQYTPVRDSVRWLEGAANERLYLFGGAF